MCSGRGLDVLVAKDGAEEFYRQLERSGTKRVLPDGMLLDVLEEDAAWVAEALATPAAGPDGLPVIALPYLVLLKMRASRGIDIGDLTRMLGAADEADLEKTRQVIRAHMSDGEEDLESLIQLGQLEYMGTRDSQL